MGSAALRETRGRGRGRTGDSEAEGWKYLMLDTVRESFQAEENGGVGVISAGKGHFVVAHSLTPF